MLQKSFYFASYVLFALAGLVFIFLANSWIKGCSRNEELRMKSLRAYYAFRDSKDHECLYVKRDCAFYQRGESKSEVHYGGRTFWIENKILDKAQESRVLKLPVGSKFLSALGKGDYLTKDSVAFYIQECYRPELKKK